MQYLHTTHQLAGQLSGRDWSDPLLRAALGLALQPWTAGTNNDAAAMRWGMFAAEVQAVADQLWPGPATVRILTEPPTPGQDVDPAVATLVEAVAEALVDAGRGDSHLHAWNLRAAAARLRDAAKELR